MTTRSRRRMAIALGVVLALVVLAWSFDGNWVRPAIERHLTRASGRSVRIDDLQLGIDRHLDLQVRLRGVAIANAPWADTRDPMAAVGEARFSMSLKSLWARRPVVPLLVLVDGRLDMQRQADGLRNWRLTHPDDRGPGHVIIQAIEAHATSLRFVHRGVDLDVTASATPNPDAQRVTMIDFTGRYHGERFGGQVATGPEITIQGTGRDFPLKGQMNAGGSRLLAEGRAADLFRRASLDGQVHVEGPSLGRLKAFLRAPLPESKPFTLDAELKKQRTEYTFARVRARVGRTSMNGDLAYDVRNDRSWIEATLRSDVAQWDDLQSLLKSGGGEPTAAVRAGDTARPLNLERLNRVDVHVDVAIGRLVDAAFPALGGLRFKASAEQGRLTLTDLAIGLAGGEATGAFSLDASATPAANAQLAWHGVRVEDLVRMADTKRVTGTVDGRIALKATGDSLDALAASLQGSVSANLRQGSLAKRLDAELGLDGARLVGSWFSGDKPIAVSCAGVAFAVAGGVATARTLAIDTATTRIAGGGTIDLRDERIALSLTPRARQPGLLTLDRSIAIGGVLGAPKVRVVDRVDQPERPDGDAACGPA